MPTLVTLKKNDPKLKSFLWGTFSKDERAVAVLSLNGSQSRDAFTFEVVHKDLIIKPNFWNRLSTTFRIPLLLLSIIPLLAAFGLLKAESYISHFEMALCFLGVGAFHLAMNLVNDVRDHFSGMDIRHPHRGSRAIQKGWFTARTMFLWAIFWFFSAAVCGVYLLWDHWLVAVSLLAAGCLIATEFSWSQLRHRVPFLKEILAGLVIGPGLFFYTAVTFSISVTQELFYYALFWGQFGALYFLLSDFESVMADDVIERKSLATKLGFDRMKSFVVFSICIQPFLFSILYFFLPLDWLVLPFLLELVFSLSLLTQVRKISSPISSDFKKVKNLFIVWYFSVGTALWILGRLDIFLGLQHSLGL